MVISKSDISLKIQDIFSIYFFRTEYFIKVEGLSNNFYLYTPKEFDHNPHYQ
jgi:hypothetical protein